MRFKPYLPPPFRIIELETVGSTNDHARQLAQEGASAGTIIWSHEQTAGRGRQGNSWTSLPGNLFMSIVFRPRVEEAHIGQISFLSAVALANVLETIVPAITKIQLKWPNDLLLNQRKAGGILIETESQHTDSNRRPWVIVGIGVNILTAPEGAISLRDIGVKTYEAGHILEFMAREMLMLVKHWEKEGFGALRAGWLGRAYKLGEKITARLPKETQTGIFMGIDQDGALQLQMPNGATKNISSAEVLM